jgi:Uma2 family endonuclease
MATVEKVVTAEEVRQMSESLDGSRCELLQGELIQMTPAGVRHGEIVLAVGEVLRGFVKRTQLGRVASNDPGIFTERDPDTVLAPDLAYWTRERLPKSPEGFAEIPPDLVVEVVSPYDTQKYLHRKVLYYLDHGVRAVWVVDPATETVVVYRSRQEIRVLAKDDEISAPDVLPGFSCRVGEFFE